MNHLDGGKARNKDKLEAFIMITVQFNFRLLPKSEGLCCPCVSVHFKIPLDKSLSFFQFFKHMLMDFSLRVSKLKGKISY